MIYWQLHSRSDAPSEKDELMNFIEQNTHEKKRKNIGPRDRIDLDQRVLRYYYSPLAKGSNSLKQILPAIIAERAFLKEKYGKSGLYGKVKSISSLNFDDHIWIRPELGSCRGQCSACKSRLTA